MQDLTRPTLTSLTPAMAKTIDTFVFCLRNVRQNFEWRDGEAVEGKASFGLPISKALPADDIEVLRQVFMRLPEPSFTASDYISLKDASCPTCGQRPRKRSVADDLKSARDKVMQHGSEFADEGFAAWVDQCLQINTDKWSRSKMPLYEHYRDWVRKGGQGGNRREKAEAKATMLTEVKWGRLMRRRFPDSWRRDKHGILYRVTVKRGA